MNMEMPRLPKVGPEIALENYQEVYEFYRDQSIVNGVARFAHRVFRHVYNPDIEFIGDAEQQIKEHFDAGKTVILASTHGLIDDPFVLASIAKRAKVLRPLIKNTIIPAKEAVFKITKIPWLDRKLRIVLDNFIALPTFRDRDYPLDKMPDLERERTEDLLRAANAMLLDQCVERLDAGNNLAIFPEGHRGDDPDEIQPLKTGIARMAQRTKKKEDLAIIPVAIRYTHERHLEKEEDESTLSFAFRSVKNLMKRRKPKVAIGELSPANVPEVDLLSMVRNGLQGCVYRTREMAAVQAGN